MQNYLYLQNDSGSSKYSAKCINNLPDEESRVLAEEILYTLASFSNYLTECAADKESPVKRLGIDACGRIVHKIMRGRRIHGVSGYETPNIRFEGMALGVVAAIAHGGLGIGERIIAERAIKSLVRLLENDNDNNIVPFARRGNQLHQSMERFFLEKAGYAEEYIAGKSAYLSFFARKSCNEWRIIYIEPVSSEPIHQIFEL